jgi:hypothetical protein
LSSRLVTSLALLAQFQIFWLAGFHYHQEVAGAQQSRRAVSAIPSHSGSQSDDSGSCAFCQIVRHSVSTPPLAAPLSFNALSTSILAAAALARPLPRKQIRLAGRDPPHSFLANC